MKIFEFSFNPKKRKDRFFEVYAYEPKSPMEKFRGSLYVVGELDNALEFNSRFLRRLTSLIQAEYYASSLKGAVPALKNALKKANLFLTQESKRGNVDWLGNLHLTLLLFITVGEKKIVFHMAKTGSGKIFLVRGGMLVDVGKNLEAGSSLQPGKVFGNLVSGTLVPGDSVTTATKEIFDILSKEKSLSELGALKEAKEFRTFFAKRSRLLSQSSGVLVSFVIEEEAAKRSSQRKSLLPSLRLPAQAGWQTFFPKPGAIRYLAKPHLMLPKGVKSLASKFNLEFPRLRQGFGGQAWMRNPSAARKRLILILLFCFLLFLGYVLF